jgi:hypothetical protein
MSTDLELMRISRNNVKELISDLTQEQLNKIPDGFNNNLIWNIGHLISTTELLIYGLTGIEEKLDNDVIKKYRKGTAPAGVVDEAEITVLLEKLEAQVDELEEDLDSDLFTNTSFQKYPTSFGYTLTNVHEAVQFNSMHEALHLGYMMAMKKNV